MPLTDSNLDELCQSLRFLIKQRRLELGLSVNRVSQLAGLNRMAVTFIENGLRVPSINTYARLAEALSMTPSELLKAAEAMTSTWGDASEHQGTDSPGQPDL